MFDGDLGNTEIWISETETKPWVSIDLGKYYGIVMVSIFNGANKNMDALNIKAGRKEDPSTMQFIVRDGTVLSGYMNDFYTTDGPILARYVYLRRSLTVAGLTKIREIKVFVQ